MADLVAEMVVIGMAEPVAMDFAGWWPEECRRQLDFMPYQDAKNPGAFLRRSIEGCYKPPDGWNKQQAELAEAEASRKRQDEFNRSQDTKEATDKKAADRGAARAAVVLGRMTEAEIESLDGAVRINVSVNGKINRRMFAANKQKLLLARFDALSESDRQEIDREIDRETERENEQETL